MRILHVNYGLVYTDDGRDEPMCCTVCGFPGGKTWEGDRDEEVIMTSHLPASLYIVTYI